MKFERYELYLGLDDKDSKRQEIPTEAAQALVQSEVAKRFDGGTIYATNGVYKHDDGTVVTERTIKMEITFYDGEPKENNVNIRSFCDWLKMVFNQESVSVARSIIESELY